MSNVAVSQQTVWVFFAFLVLMVMRMRYKI